MRVFDLRDTSTHSERVTFNGALTLVGSIYNGVKHLLAGKYSGTDVHMVVGRGNTAQLVFTSERDCQRLYVYSATQLTDVPFTNWKTLLKQLECKQLDVSCSPTDYERHDDYRRMGLVDKSQRVRFTVGKKAALPEMVYLRMDELTLSQSAELGRIALARSGELGQELLKGLAYGTTTGIVVPNDNGDIVGALIFNDGTKEIQSEGIIINAPLGSRAFGQWFMLLMNAFIREAKRLRKPAVASFSPGVEIKLPFEHVEVDVVSLHFGIAGRGTDPAF
ncbi:hypothetical protein pEaSNUABM11_00136 [Erwinia phage pEa_SNUABM_11]|nr:hypothetical protein pEaSNUABM11_00136 [Erwinia phage pEa_SNUABM_11]